MSLETLPSLNKPLPIPADRTHHLNLIIDPEDDEETEIIRLVKIMPEPREADEQAYSLMVVDFEGRKVIEHAFRWVWKSSEAQITFYKVSEENFELIEVEDPYESCVCSTIWIALTLGQAPISESEWWMHFWGAGGWITSQTTIAELQEFSRDATVH